MACIIGQPSGISIQQLAQVQSLCDLVIAAALRLCGTKKNSLLCFFDLPCAHGLWELCHRTLPALRNGNFAKVDSFETRHGLLKRVGGGSNHESYSLKSMLVTEAMTRALHGMRWGDKQQFMLGRAWGKVKRHPIFVGMTPFSGMRSATRVPGWAATDGTSNIVITDSHKEKIFEELRRTHQDVDWPTVTLRSIRGFRRLHLSSAETVLPGDSVHLLFNDEPAWALLREPFVEVTWGGEVLLFAFPVWFTPSKRRDQQQLHSLRGTALLTSYLSPGDNAFLQPPVEVNRIVERVLVVHSCKRDCSFPGHLNCRCDPNCYVRCMH